MASKKLKDIICDAHPVQFRNRISKGAKRYYDEELKYPLTLIGRIHFGSVSDQTYINPEGKVEGKYDIFYQSKCLDYTGCFNPYKPFTAIITLTRDYHSEPIVKKISVRYKVDFHKPKIEEFLVEQTFQGGNFCWYSRQMSEFGFDPKVHKEKVEQYSHEFGEMIWGSIVQCMELKEGSK